MKKLILVFFALVVYVNIYAYDEFFIFSGERQKITKVYLHLGQSNMEGFPNGAPPSYIVTSPYLLDSCYNYYKGEITGLQYPDINWHTAADSAAFPATPFWHNSFGPEFSLAYTLRNYYSENIIIIKMTVGGTSLGVDWAPGSYLREKMSVYYHAAMKEIIRLGFPSPYLAGVHYNQGEDDSVLGACPGCADNYADNLRDLRDEIRTYLYAKDATFVTCRLGRTYSSVGGLIVRSKQEEVGNDDNSFWYDQDRQGLTADSVHFNNQGVTDAGISAANQFTGVLRTAIPAKIDSITFSSLDANQIIVNYDKAIGSDLDTSNVTLTNQQDTLIRILSNRLIIYTDHDYIATESETISVNAPNHKDIDKLIIPTITDSTLTK